MEELRFTNFREQQEFNLSVHNIQSKHSFEVSNNAKKIVETKKLVSLRRRRAREPRQFSNFFGFIIVTIKAPKTN